MNIRFVEITNRYGKNFLVPEWKAKEMIASNEIKFDDCKVKEVEEFNNIHQPESQEDFEKTTVTTKTYDEIVNDNIEFNGDYKEIYKQKYNKDIPNNKKNDLEWIKSKI